MEQEMIDSGSTKDPYDLGPPPSEQAIIANWTTTRDCRVSICMLTYNHAKFLRSALNGILCQDAPFGFEILVHDDASTDDTQAILREYHANYPSIIKPIYQSINQYSQGGRPSAKYNYPRAHAEFVAWCEGDDCWTDRRKLRIQIESMDQHPEVDLSFHPANKIDYSYPEPRESLMGAFADREMVIDFLDIMHRKHGGAPTAACIIRQRAFSKFYDFVRTRDYLTIGDLYHQIFGALRGGAFYLPTPMSVYRYATEHSWTRSITVDLEKKCAHEIAMIRSFVELDEVTGHSYQFEFKKLILQRIFWLFNSNSAPTEIVEKLALEPFQNLYQALKNLIQTSAKALDKSGAQYMIFGAGSGCALILDEISQAKIVSIIDRDGGMVGQKIRGIRVEPISAIAQHKDCGLIISTLSRERPLLGKLIAEGKLVQSQVEYFLIPLLGAIDLEKLGEACVLPLQRFQPRGVSRANRLSR